MPYILSALARHYDPRTKRATWTAQGRLFTGRGAHMRALAAARAGEHLRAILHSIRKGA